MNAKRDSRVAQFITDRIEATKKKQKDIAEKAGFETPNMITMIKQGLTKLPLDKVGGMAEALEVDPLYLLKICMEEYCPNTWQAISPQMEIAITHDERRLIQSLRDFVGGPYLASLNGDSKKHLNDFLLSLRTPATIH